VSAAHAGCARILTGDDQVSDYPDLLELVYRARPKWQADGLCHERPGINFLPEDDESPLEAVRTACDVWSSRSARTGR
jgi:hypothetical protein